MLNSKLSFCAELLWFFWSAIWDRREKWQLDTKKRKMIVFRSICLRNLWNFNRKSEALLPIFWNSKRIFFKEAGARSYEAVIGQIEWPDPDRHSSKQQCSVLHLTNCCRSQLDRRNVQRPSLWPLRWRSGLSRRPLWGCCRNSGMHSSKESEVKLQCHQTLFNEFPISYRKFWCECIG